MAVCKECGREMPEGDGKNEKKAAPPDLTNKGCALLVAGIFGLLALILGPIFYNTTFFAGTVIEVVVQGAQVIEVNENKAIIVLNGRKMEIKNSSMDMTHLEKLPNGGIGLVIDSIESMPAVHFSWDPYGTVIYIDPWGFRDSSQAMITRSSLSDGKYVIEVLK